MCVAIIRVVELTSCRTVVDSCSTTEKPLSTCQQFTTTEPIIITVVFSVCAVLMVVASPHK